MEDNIYDNLEFEMYYLHIVAFQEKELYGVINNLGGGRLNDSLKFIGYSHLTFDENDNLHRFPKINKLEKFVRGKTNSVVYDLVFNIQNYGYYDKLVIYKSWSIKTSYYGYVLYNSKTGHSSHRYLLDSTPESIPCSLARDFNVMYNMELVDHYLSKSIKYNKKFKNDNRGVLGLPTQKDYQNVMSNYQMRLENPYNGKLVSEFLYS